MQSERIFVRELVLLLYFIVSESQIKKPTNALYLICDLISECTENIMWNVLLVVYLTTLRVAQL
jgi:hypothetical protein